MTKQEFIKIFTKNLTHILQKEAQSDALESLGECIPLLDAAWDKTLRSGTITEQNRKLVREEFATRINLFKMSGAIHEKAAHFALTTFDRMRLESSSPKVATEGKGAGHGAGTGAASAESSWIPRTTGYEREAFEEHYAQAKQIKQRQNIEIFRETKTVVERVFQGQATQTKLDQKLLAESRKNTVFYRSSKKGEIWDLTSASDKQFLGRPSAKPFVPNFNKQVFIFDEDAAVIAKKLAARGSRPLVQILANKISILGGVEEGSNAQEEHFARLTTLFHALYPHGTLQTSGPHAGRMYYKHQLPEFGSGYVPSVQLFRDPTKSGYPAMDPISFACIEIAGYDLAKPHLFEASLREGGEENGKPLVGAALEKAFFEHTQDKLRHNLEVAILHGHTTLSLGAPSCGAFKLPNDIGGKTAELVARAYETVLCEKAYFGRFELYFAVLSLGTDGQVNYVRFSEMVQRLNKHIEQVQQKGFVHSTAGLAGMSSSGSMGAGSAAAAGSAPLHFSGSSRFEASASASEFKGKDEAIRQQNSTTDGKQTVVKITPEAETLVRCFDELEFFGMPMLKHVEKEKQKEALKVVFSVLQSQGMMQNSPEFLRTIAEMLESINEVFSSKSAKPGAS